MAPHRIFRVAAVLSGVALFVHGCSRETPTSPSGDDARGVPGSSAAVVRPGPARAVAILLPNAISSIRVFPEMGIRDGGGVDGDMYSTYFRTTDANREFRRGFAEFAIPEFSEGFFGAGIVLRETRGWTAHPMPPDRHELSAYADVDLEVSTSDFDRPASLVGTFETDANEDTRTFEFDASSLVSRSRGARLGLRSKLEDDPAEARYIHRGSGFSGSSTPAGVVIQVLTTVPAAIDHLQEMVQAMAEGQVIPRDTKASVLRHLQLAEDIVRDDNPRNDVAACRALSAIIDEVDSVFWNGRGMAAPQASYIMESAQHIKTGLGCALSRGRLPEGRRDPRATDRVEGRAAGP